MKLIIGNEYALVNEVKSNFKGMILAKANEKVKLISISEPAVIIEGENGNIFSSNINNLR